MSTRFDAEGGYELLFGLTELSDIVSIQKQFTEFLNQWGKPVKYTSIAEPGDEVGVILPLKSQNHAFGYVLASRAYDEQTPEYKSKIYSFLHIAGLILENCFNQNAQSNPSLQWENSNPDSTNADRHRFIVEQSTDGIMLVDENGIVIEWNKSQERITGWNAKECIGKPLWEVRWLYMPKSERTPETLVRLEESIRRALNSGRSTVFRETFEAEIERKDGSTRFEEVHSYPIQTSKGFMIGILTRDTTTRKLAEKGLIRHEAILNALRYSGDVLLSGTTWKDHTEKILAHIGEALNVSRMYVYEGHTEDRNIIYAQHFEWCAPGVTPNINYPLIQNINLPIDSYEGWWKKLQSHELITGKPEDFSEKESAYFKDHNTSYLAVAPIFIGDELWGFIGFEDEKDDTPLDPIEHESILAIANNLGNAILREKSELALHESELREHNRADELQALLDSTPAAVWIAYDPECKMMTGNKAAYDMLQMPYGTNLSKTGDAKEVEHFKLLFEGKEAPSEKLPMQQAAASGRTFINIQEAIHFNNGSKIDLVGNVVPLLDNNGKSKGAIGAFLDITQQKQTELHLRKRMQIMSVISDVDSIITASFNIKHTLASIISHLVNSSFCEAASIFILNEKTQLLDYISGHGFRKSIPKNLHIKLGEGIAGSVAASAEPIVVPINESNNDGLIKVLINNEGFTYCYCYPMVVKKQVKGVIEIFLRRAIPHDPERSELYEMIAKRAAIAIENGQLLENLEQTNLDLLQAYDVTIEGWSRAMDLRDKETEGHTLRVTQTAINLARLANIPDSEIQFVRWGALLHDIGKLGVPDSILLKPGTLSDEEWTVMKQHPVYAFQMLSPIKYLQLATDIPYCHHERWDGSGYPRGLSGDTIPLAARLFSVIDVWDALTSNRPYRPAWSKERAIEYLQMNSGIQFDPYAVKLFFQLDDLNPII
jgi:PAS domain S-box-containing protein/putative nucleotidyltransferase with HDIG domain